MTLETALAVSRIVHFSAMLLAFGAALFPLYAKLAPHFPTRAVAAVALFSALAWFSCVLLNVAGDLATAFSPQEIGLVLLKTGFGKAWLVHLALCASFLLAAMAGQRIVSLVMAGLTLVSLAGIGHAAAGEGAGHIARLVSQAVHLLAVGVWLGGVAPLWQTLGPATDSERQRIVGRFTSVGYGAVALVLLSGVLNTRLITGEFLPSLSSPYGQLLLLKIALFLILAAVALVNQFYSTRRGRWMFLRRGIIAELAIFTAILLVVGWLGITPPMDIPMAM